MPVFELQTAKPAVSFKVWHNFNLSTENTKCLLHHPKSARIKAAAQAREWQAVQGKSPVDSAILRCYISRNFGDWFFNSSQGRKETA